MYRFVNRLKRWYLKLMFWIVGRGLVAGSKVDAEFKRELAALPASLVIRMVVMPSGPNFTVRVKDNKELEIPGKAERDGLETDLTIYFKHLAHAFLVFSFQEGTARAFANDRMYVDGEIGHAMVLVRCLNRMEALILPKFVAKRAVKRYPDIGLGEKLAGGAKIYSRLLF